MSVESTIAKIAEMMRKDFPSSVADSDWKELKYSIQDAV